MQGQTSKQQETNQQHTSPTIPEATLEEFLELEFAGKAKLFLPAVQIDLV